MRYLQPKVLATKTISSFCQNWGHIKNLPANDVALAGIKDVESFRACIAQHVMGPMGELLAELNVTFKETLAKSIPSFSTALGELANNGFLPNPDSQAAIAEVEGFVRQIAIGDVVQDLAAAVGDDNAKNATKILAGMSEMQVRAANLVFDYNLNQPKPQVPAVTSLNFNADGTVAVANVVEEVEARWASTKSFYEENPDGKVQKLNAEVYINTFLIAPVVGRLLASMRDIVEKTFALILTGCELHIQHRQTARIVQNMFQKEQYSIITTNAESLAKGKVAIQTFINKVDLIYPGKYFPKEFRTNFRKFSDGLCGYGKILFYSAMVIGCNLALNLLPGSTQREKGAKLRDYKKLCKTNEVTIPRYMMVRLNEICGAAGQTASPNE